jgi:hypothetical protein
VFCCDDVIAIVASAAITTVPIIAASNQFGVLLMPSGYAWGLKLGWGGRGSNPRPTDYEFGSDDWE